MTRISSATVDHTIESALNSISHSLQANAEEVFAAQADGLAASEQLLNWIEDEIETTDGVRLTRAEFRRRLESERARHAGHAERFRLNESCEKLEQLVLGGVFTLLMDDSPMIAFRPRDVQAFVRI